MTRARILALLLAAGASLPAQSRLDEGFLDPPSDTKPWVYWYWASDRISREGITKDLESMAAAGIGEALIGNVLLQNVERGPVRALTEEWWTLVEHAIREGGRVGVDLGIFNCPGWSQAGGPWVKPGQSMRSLTVHEWRVTGPAKFEGAVKTPEHFQDVAIMAFPAPTGEGQVHAFPLPPKAATSQFTDLDLPAPFTARSLSLQPAAKAFSARCELLALNPAGRYETVRKFTIDRTQAEGVAQVGPMKHGEVAISFPAVTATDFRLEVTPDAGLPAFTGISLSAAARVDRFVEKQLGIMHQDPLPPWDAYVWPTPAPEARGIAPEEVVDLAGALDSNGVVRWDVPAGDWIILRTGMTPTGAMNAPTTEEARGFEVDKMSRQAVAAHFDAYVGKLLARMPAADRRALKHVVADSWEAGPQNWTDAFAGQFQARYGYDPGPWLPVLTGRVIGNADRSDRFLWDLRRLVADRIASDYAGGLREACNKHGLKLWLQNYGHWGFPAEFLQYGGQADAVAGEFWAGMPYGKIEMRAASSAAHVHGKRVVSAEAFTGGRPFQETPWSLKRLGDRALANGINHFALHLFFHQPSEDRPGVNAWFGSEFNRHNTWFGQCGAWVDSWRSAQFLLQQGRPVADIAVFIGEDAPKMTGPTIPELPPGYDFDWIDAETILKRVSVENGRLTVPGGASWRILVLPRLQTMRPELLKKIRDLVHEGAAVLGDNLWRSPSLEGFPGCDERVAALSNELWAGCMWNDRTRPPFTDEPFRHAPFGRGYTFFKAPVRRAIEELRLPPDVDGIDPRTILWTHRATSDADIYFLSNQSDEPVSIAPSFRVAGRAPEIWRPDRRSIERVATFAASAAAVRVPVDLDAGGSCFVVFREPATGVPAVTEVTRDGRVVLSAAPRLIELPKEGHRPYGSFAMALWAAPDVDITLPVETDTGVATPAARNDAIFPLHGGTALGDVNSACAGISAGRNGVVVYEHATQYFAPILVHEAPLSSWTHVAVVYSGNRPTLYLNGKLAREGLQSQHLVRASPDVSDPAIQKVLAQARVETGKPFAGQLRNVERFERMLTASEVAGLARVPFALGAARPDIRLSRTTDGGLEAEVSAGGDYRLALADGRVLDLPAPALQSPLPLDGPWDVMFPPAMDVPERTTLDRLIPLTEHGNEAIRCFSGTAAYGHRFELPATWLGEHRRVLLDLGSVESLAEVFVNARPFGVLWKPPFVIDVTSALVPRSNSLSIRVTNTWWNRLLGDQLRPDGFSGAGPLQFKPRLAFADRSRLTGDLIPSGLMGPVRLYPALRLRVR